MSLGDIFNSIGNFFSAIGSFIWNVELWVLGIVIFFIGSVIGLISSEGKPWYIVVFWTVMMFFFGYLMVISLPEEYIG